MKPRTKPRPPLKIWVCNRTDGWTTFGLYYNAKRRVFARARTLQEFYKLVEKGWFQPKEDETEIEWMGDPLPRGWRYLIDSHGRPRDSVFVPV